MKKIILPLLAVAAFGMASAQVEFTGGVNGSYRVPFIINQNNYGQSELEYRATSGYGTGLRLGTMFHNRMFGFFVEANYARYGQNYLGEESAGSQDVQITKRVKLNYFEIPVMFRYVTDHTNKWGAFYSMAGAQFMVLQKAQIDYFYGGEKVSPFPPERFSSDHNKAFEKSDVGLIFDIGYLKCIGKKKNMEITAGIRGYYGLRDINSPAYRIPNLDGVYEKSNNAVGGLNVSWSYIIGKGSMKSSKKNDKDSKNKKK